MTRTRSERRLSRQQNEPPVDYRIEVLNHLVKVRHIWRHQLQARGYSSQQEWLKERHLAMCFRMAWEKVSLCLLVLQLTQTKPYGWNTVAACAARDGCVAELLAGGRLWCVCWMRTWSEFSTRKVKQFWLHAPLSSFHSRKFGLSAFYYSILERFFSSCWTSYQMSKNKVCLCFLSCVCHAQEEQTVFDCNWYEKLLHFWSKEKTGYAAGAQRSLIQTVKRSSFTPFICQLV